MKTIKLYLSMIILSGVYMLTACSDDTALKVEPVEPPAEEETAYHDLFTLSPGKIVPLKSYGGAVDPVGTTMADDFDGDGISNEKETTGNVWVADYPVIETNIATPVTMAIEILYASDTQQEIISTDISVDDITRAKDSSSDAVHRNEINTRTVQYIDEMSRSKSESHEYEVAVSVSTKTLFGGGKASARTKIANSFSNSYSEKKNCWKDVPFKNNVESNGWTLKGTEASKNARNLRQEIREKGDATTKIKPNAGYIRAALYISNYAVNMPVKLSNVMCSMILQDSRGQIIPVQSFMLRNDDYSPFSVDLYGGEDFGPYVIELKNLNTNEIKSALSQGYTPKIYIISYEMRHVEDSNYRMALSDSFTGDNLKIIEENAKGRTAAIRIIGPDYRKMFRVCAFDTNANESRNTRSSEVSTVRPGVSLEKALKRISYSGVEIECAYYIMDISSLDFKTGTPLAQNPKVLVRGIKSINGIASNVPVIDTIEDESLGTIYVMKPPSTWTQEEFEQYRLWAVYADGRYYMPEADMLDAGGNPRSYDYNGQQIIMAQGINGPDSIIWPGDHYDIALFDFKEFMEKKEDFGNNPIESTVDNEESPVKFNTRWNSNDLGESPFDPDVKSQYLGAVTLGDTIEFTIKLNDTFYLNPNFGTPLFKDNAEYYNDFSYNRQRVNRRFDLTEALDFEVSFGLGGAYTSWFNLVPERSPLSDLFSDEAGEGVKIVDTYWDFLNQEFTVRVRIPDDLPGVAPNGFIKMYMRTALNNAYRESIWPHHFSEVKKFRGELVSAAVQNSDVLEVINPVGNPSVNDVVFIDGDSTSYTIQEVNMTEKGYSLKLSTPLVEGHSIGGKIYINLTDPLDAPEVEVAVENGFITDWNAQYGFDPSTVDADGRFGLVGGWGDPDNFPAKLGFSPSPIIANWIGNYNFGNPYWNNWTDAGKFDEFISNLYGDFLTTNTAKFFGFPGDFTELTLPAAQSIVADNVYGNAYSMYQTCIASKKFIFNGKLVHVWTNGAQIYGRIASINGGVVAWDAPAFLIATRASTNYAICELDVCGTASNRIAVVYNETNWAVRMQLVDLNLASGTGTCVGTAPLVLQPARGQCPRIQYYGGNKALFIFKYWNSDNQYIFAKVIDTESNTFTAINTTIFSTSHGFYQPQLVIDGNKALICARYSGGNMYGYICNLSNITNDSLSGRSLGVINRTVSYVRYFNAPLIVSNHRALVVWQRGTSDANLDIYGTVVDMGDETFGNEQVMWTKDILISTTTLNQQDHPQIAIKDDKAFVAWESNDSGINYDIRGRVIDLSTGQPVKTEDFLISTDKSWDQKNAALVNVNGDMLAIWQSQNASNLIDVRCALINVTNSATISSVPLQLNATSVNSGSRFDIDAIHIPGSINAFVTWKTPSATNYNLISRVVQFNSAGGTDFSLGMNNFFKAPLIERNYEVKVRLVEDLGE